MLKTANFAGALLLGLLIATSAAAQDSSDLFPGGVRNLNYIFLSIFGANQLSAQGAVALQIQKDFDHAVDGLREGNARKFYSNRARLRRHIRKPGIAARNRRLAKHLMAALPVKYAEGFTFLRDDGTVAADPDPRIRSQLNRDRYSSEDGDSADAE